MNWLLAALALPYLGFVGYDALLHPGRRVPRMERLLHGVAGASVLTFLACTILGSNAIAAFSLAIALPAMFLDEWIYHRRLGTLESRVHVAAHTALGLYIVVWLVGMA